MKKKLLISGLFCSLMLGSGLTGGVTKVAADTQDQAETELQVVLRKKITPEVLPGETPKDESNKNIDTSTPTIAVGSDSLEQKKTNDLIVKTELLPKTGTIQSNLLLYSGLGVLLSTFFLLFISKPKHRDEVGD
ncbi:hypothetical protein A5844_002182 [Enterococcus sp. 10A9_DIV0425]|uniref:Gram-positive cocci surface proteins LPxTG domain-containing protein n=1 Tax=Candidatus Enterococcus wittei TaxID=1987383 RepID=A0A242JZ24_9ENTE|nr:LPXTG cell wall anchor domain-containing protein [Enterococcus sp. 10A9_DIV0425]OTP10482.1 hypothetical protein A5844_002182 [Enterococcus sp. 10A9_DIV0425]THE12895.1 LPXTG cell wall anchor domain-containing protein [Enterococcus hirae]